MGKQIENQCIAMMLMWFLIGGMFSSSVATVADFQGLGFLPNTPKLSKALAISEDGTTVVGYSGIDTDKSTVTESFRWTVSEGMVGLGDVSGGISLNLALAVSGDGSVIGGKAHFPDDSPADGDTGYSYRWTQETGMISMGVAGTGGTDERVRGISNDGSVIVGSGHRKEFFTAAYKWTEAGGFDLFLGQDQKTDAFGISGDGSVIVGLKVTEAIRWSSSEGLIGLGDLTGGSFDSTALGVSLDGSVIVGRGNSDSGTEAFRWTDSESMIGLGDFTGGGFSSQALDVSNDGSVIVGFGTTDFGSEAFIWNATDGMLNLKEILVGSFGLDLTGWTLTAANGISGDGLTIVGTGINPLGFQEAWVATIPEPLTLSFLALGGLVLRRRRI